MRTGKKENEISSGIFLLIIILLIGVAIGTVMIKYSTDTQLDYLKQITDDYISLHHSGSMIKIFCSSLVSSGIFLLIAFFVGYFALGKPVSLFIPLFKGLGLGVCMADIFSRYGKDGFKISLILIIPSAILSSFAVVFASRQAGRNSSEIFSYICGRPIKTDDNQNGISFSNYIIKFTAFFALALLGAILDAILSHFFGSIL